MIKRKYTQTFYSDYLQMIDSTFFSSIYFSVFYKFHLMRKYNFIIRKKCLPKNASFWWWALSHYTLHVLIIRIWFRMNMFKLFSTPLKTRLFSSHWKPQTYYFSRSSIKLCNSFLLKLQLKLLGLSVYWTSTMCLETR